MNDRGTGYSAVIQEYQIAAFLVFTSGWTWTVRLSGIALGYGDTRGLQAVGAWGPPLAAAAVTKAAGYDVRTWAAQLFPKHGVRLR